MIEKRNRSVSGKTELFLKQWDLQIMAVPAILFIFVFSYIPIWGLLMGFQNYDLFQGMWKSPWVGLEHFKRFFDEPSFTLIFRNTLVISLLKLALGFPAPIILALMINEAKCLRFKKSFQTISYLPYFLSWVVVGGLMSQFLSPEGGALNDFLQKLHLVSEPVNWLSTPEYFWWILVMTNVWKNVGFSAIIYLAAIAGINPELYEASDIDGASRFRQIFLITLPSLVPVMIILLILAVGNVLNAGFDDILQLTANGTNSILLDVSDVIDTYVYRVGIKYQEISYATAVGLFKSVVNVLFLVGANAFFKKTTESSLW